MKAIVYHQYGNPSVLRMEEITVPTPSAGQVLVKVYAVSVNPVDWKVLSGKLRFITGNKFPKMTGIEGSGVIEGVGADVTGFIKGQRVFVALDYNGGVCAEYVVAPSDKIMPISDIISHTEAATMAIAGLTALQGLRDKGNIKAGMHVLVNGASGGVGTYTVQIAKYFGAVVTAVCSSKNSELVKRLGADHVIDYTRDNFTEQKNVYDIIFDAVGNKSFRKVKGALKKNGVYINIVPSFSLYVSSFLTSLRPGKKSMPYMLKPVISDLKEIMDLITEKKIKVIIDKVYSFEHSSNAFEHSKTGHARGKVVITVKQETVGLSELC